MAKVLSDEHKRSIGAGTKRMWERGVFDSEEIREKWRQTALSGIAKKGKISEQRYIPSKEMLDDFTKMGDKEMSAKWGVSSALLIRLRKRNGIKAFKNQHGTIPHKIENGVEYKRCGQGHWKSVDNFGKQTSRLDGLRSWCKECESNKNKEYYDNNDGAKKMRDWVKTEKGKKSKSATMRKVWAKRRGNYIKFDLDDEEKIYNLCNQSCAYCKTPVGFDELEFDHFISIKSGGMTEPSNMLPSCTKCNRGRGGKFNRDPKEWIIWRFGDKIGQEIYDNCIRILSNL